MWNFLQTAREIRDRGVLLPEDARRFDNVIKYWVTHDFTEKAARLNLSNLEDLFGLLDLNVRVDPTVTTIREDMIFMILRTLEHRITPDTPTDCAILHTAANGNAWGNRSVSVMRQFVDLVARRWSPPPLRAVVRDSIISTNYDVLVEEALTSGDMEADYALPDYNPPPRANVKVMVKLLKLHGSANWSICKSGEHVKVHPPGTRISTVEAGPCETCGNHVEPFIVPPTWSKGEHRAALESVWKAAFEELVSARRWIFIGTSLPDTDRFLRYLFGLALQRNTDLDRIVIINPNKSGYDDLFQEHASKISLSPTIRGSFENIIIGGQGLMEALGYVAFDTQYPLW